MLLAPSPCLTATVAAPAADGFAVDPWRSMLAPILGAAFGTIEDGARRGKLGGAGGRLRARRKPRADGSASALRSAGAAGLGVRRRSWLDMRRQSTLSLPSKWPRLPEYQRLAGIADLSPGVDAAKYACAGQADSSLDRRRRLLPDQPHFSADFRALRTSAGALCAPARTSAGSLWWLSRQWRGNDPFLFAGVVFRACRRARRDPADERHGTARPNSAEDQANRAALLASAKERAENIMIVDLLRNDLGRLAQPGKVQRRSLVRGGGLPDPVADGVYGRRGPARRRPCRAVRRLFPCGSITGAPKIQRHAAHRRAGRISRAGCTRAPGLAGAEWRLPLQCRHSYHRSRCRPGGPDSVSAAASCRRRCGARVRGMPVESELF
jgi:hypothetical protein